MKEKTIMLIGVGVFFVVFFALFAWYKGTVPVVENAILTYAPAVPPPVARKPGSIHINLTFGRKVMSLGNEYQYEFWTFNARVPGPFIRVRVGDTLFIHVSNKDTIGMPHNNDLHAVTGPGGGAVLLSITPGEEKTAQFKLMHPGLFLYHCAAPPPQDHIANGMYGLILVEPQGGLPKVDREFYVLQSELYAREQPGTTVLYFSHEDGLNENPRYVVFNGQIGSLLGSDSLKAKVGEKIRIYFGNAGPNRISSFHIIGEIFDKVFREGDLITPPARSVQTTLVPAGGTTVVEFKLEVPGTYALVDHAIFRIEKGAVGFLEVEGKAEKGIYYGVPAPCKDCKVH